MKEPQIIKVVPTATDIEEQDRNHQSTEIALGIATALIVSTAAILAFPDIAFAWVVAAVPLIWLGACWLYSDSYDEWV